MSHDNDRAPRRPSLRNWLLATLGIALLVVAAAALWASGDPDGLERVAVDLGFIEAGREAPYEILPDYTVPGMDGVASMVIAGVIGLLVVAGLVLVIGRLLARRQA